MITTHQKITSTKELYVGQIHSLNEGGSITIVKMLAGRLARIRHNDCHAHITDVFKSAIVKGGIHNPYHRNLQGVGYVGVGGFKPCTNKKISIHYEKWQSIIQRCYNPYKVNQHPKFITHTVCDEWHNFQVFAEWYEGLEFNDCRYQLVKTLIDRDNTVYNPEHCFLVPKEINMVLGTAVEGVYPYGIIFNRAKQMYQVVHHKKSTGSVLTSYLTLETCIEGYITHKEDHVKELANEWRDRLPARTYEALLQWRVES